MAFHDLRAGSSFASHRGADTTVFSPFEWSVISLARQEAAGTTPAPRGRWQKLAAWFRATPPLRPLANERLEALRRLAADLWHGQDPVGSGNLALFRAAGFAEPQLGLLRAVANPCAREIAA